MSALKICLPTSYIKSFFFFFFLEVIVKCVVHKRSFLTIACILTIPQGTEILRDLCNLWMHWLSAKCLNIHFVGAHVWKQIHKIVPDFFLSFCSMIMKFLLDAHWHYNTWLHFTVRYLHKSLWQVSVSFCHDR